MENKLHVRLKNYDNERKSWLVAFYYKVRCHKSSVKILYFLSTYKNKKKLQRVNCACLAPLIVRVLSVCLHMQWAPSTGRGDTVMFYGAIKSNVLSW